MSKPRATLTTTTAIVAGSHRSAAFGRTHLSASHPNSSPASHQFFLVGSSGKPGGGRPSCRVGTNGSSSTLKLLGCGGPSGPCVMTRRKALNCSWNPSSLRQFLSVLEEQSRRLFHARALCYLIIIIIINQRRNKSGNGKRMITL